LHIWPWKIVEKYDNGNNIIIVIIINFFNVYLLKIKKGYYTGWSHHPFATFLS